jgi:ribonuclease HI
MSRAALDRARLEEYQVSLAMPEYIHTLTVDASHDVATGLVGIGIVLQQRMGKGRRGPIIEQIAECHGCVRSGKGEMLAIVRALEIAGERGLSHIKVRSDYNWLRRSLRAKHREGLTDVGLGGHALRLARRFDWIDFGYVPRRKNQLAHSLARQARALLAICSRDCALFRCGLAGQLARDLEQDPDEEFVLTPASSIR